jgi:hypothetical protein
VVGKAHPTTLALERRTAGLPYPGRAEVRFA